MIVSEIGLNHLGDSDYADLYLENLINAKSEAVTFQIAEKSFYEKKSNEGLTLTNEYYSKASKLCHKNKIKFGIALSDEEMIDFFENINVDFYKTRSKDIANFSLLSKLGKTGKKLFLSTGLAGIPEIQKAIKKPGALRASLGVKKGKDIPAKKLAKAAKAKGKLGQRARLAETLKGFKKADGGMITEMYSRGYGRGKKSKRKPTKIY